MGIRLISINVWIVVHCYNDDSRSKNKKKSKKKSKRKRKDKKSLIVMRMVDDQMKMMQCQIVFRVIKIWISDILVYERLDYSYTSEFLFCDRFDNMDGCWPNIKHPTIYWCILVHRQMVHVVDALYYSTILSIHPIDQDTLCQIDHWSVVGLISILSLKM